MIHAQYITDEGCSLTYAATRVTHEQLCPIPFLRAHEGANCDLQNVQELISTGKGMSSGKTNYHDIYLRWRQHVAKPQ